MVTTLSRSAARGATRRAWRASFFFTRGQRTYGRHPVDMPRSGMHPHVLFSGVRTACKRVVCMDTGDPIGILLRGLRRVGRAKVQAIRRSRGRAHVVNHLRSEQGNICSVFRSVYVRITKKWSTAIYQSEAWAQKT